MVQATSGRPSILFVINSLAGGGAERVVSRLLALSEPYTDRYRISLALLDKAAIAYPVPDFVTVHQLDSRGSFWRSICELRRLVRQLKPDLRLSFLTRANVANRFASNRRSVPWLVSERINTSAHLGTGPRAALVKALVRLTYPSATRVIAVSRGVGEELIRHYGVDRERVDVVANPVDLDSIRAEAVKSEALDTARPFIFAMGRLTGSKNHAMLLRAFARSTLRARLVIAGDGPDREALLACAQQLGIADRVDLPGFLANPYATMRLARVFALSSNVEGFPNALVEALAVGVPAVATNCPDGPAEILANTSIEEVDGLVVAAAGLIVPVNDERLLAEALKMLFEGPLRDEVIAGANKRVQDYSPRQAVENYWGIIERVLAR